MEKDKECPPFIPAEVWDHARAAGSELRKSVASIVPPEVGQHRRAAQKEVLLAFRSLIDAALDRIDKKGSPSPAGQ